MTTVRLGYTGKGKYKWEVLPDGNKDEKYNERFVISIDNWLWMKVQNIIKIREKGFDSVILIDGDRRTGKSTLGKIIAYLLNPDLTINNYVAGMEEAATKLDKAKIDDVLIFDEGSLIANSKQTMSKKNVQLEKIIDVIGQKRLCLIFCMPSFFNISRPIAVAHSRFLIRTYTDTNLSRGRYCYWSTKRKKTLYEVGKKNNNSYKFPSANFKGRFSDFKLPFEDEYLKLKQDSLAEALNPELKKLQAKEEKKNKEISKEKIVEILLKVKEMNPNITDRSLCDSQNISPEYFCRVKAEKRATPMVC